jgi:DNA-binding GntR family transcriptional regulator
VRDAIDRGELEPGGRVSEYQVAGWLKISRTPAREALQRLEAEGLLSYSPRRGLVVISMDDDALDELYQAREIIEGTLARMAASNGSGPMIASILRLSEIEPTLVDDVERMYLHNREFHEMIYRAAHNRYLAKASISMHDVVAADRRGPHLLDKTRRLEVIEEHRAMATAIAERRAADAEEAAAAHIRAARRNRIRRDLAPVT